MEKAVREAYTCLTGELIRRHLTITAMESVTGGLVASLITDTEGSSAVLKGSFVTYSNEAKIAQGVPAEVIEQYSVYSEETAAAMAEACRAAYRADIGIGVTGTLGNVDPANQDASVPGEVYFAVSMTGSADSCCAELQGTVPEPRETVQEQRDPESADLSGSRQCRTETVHIRVGAHLPRPAAKAEIAGEIARHILCRLGIITG